MKEQLERWRHLIEPLIAQSITPLEWDRVPGMVRDLYAGDHSVVVTCDATLYGRPSLGIWVAVGKLEEVRELLEQAYDQARQRGLDCVAYMGRRGWVRELGYREVAVVGVKEL